MSSKSVKAAKWQWAARDRISHMLSAGLLAVIVVSGAISAHGQQGPRSAPPAQGGAPAQTFSPAAPAPPAPAETVPRPAAPLSAPGAPPSVCESTRGAPQTVLGRSETLPPAAGAPAAAERSTYAQLAAEPAASAVLPRDLTPYRMFMSADIVVNAVMLGLLFASVLTWTIWLAKNLELFG